jgi:hypothetical protein
MYKTIAQGLLVPAHNGLAARRMVIRQYEDTRITEYVVTPQYTYEDGSQAFGNGTYFHSRTPGDTEVLTRAFAEFTSRCTKDVEAFCELQAHQGFGILSGGEEASRAHL